jgi:poly(A) polymerase
MPADIRLRSFSALDAFLGLPSLPFVFGETAEDLQTLARRHELRFPGVEIADCAAVIDGVEWYVNCDAGAAVAGDSAGGGAEIILSEERNAFLLETAVIASRYGTLHFPKILALAETLRAGEPRPEAQRLMLSALLLSERPNRGLTLLKTAGFVDAYWKELASLDDAEQSKEFHPEGNAWRHTLETFRYRKAGAAGHDLVLSLALLLHDTGKPLASSFKGNRFNGHAELGVAAAKKFLKRLEFPSSLTEDVCWLIKNHMLPAALPELPLVRTETVMNSALFPTLMELYRCDESSSFKGLDGYYRSSAAYRQFLRHKKNPYRKEGKGGCPGSWLLPGHPLHLLPFR